jgi:NADH:ubiquinone oxidoreductase subunit 4 (subunit M)
MLLVLQTFAERGDALKNWLMIIFSQIFIILAIAFLNDKYEYAEIFIYLSGLSFAAILGCFCLINLKKTEETVELNKFNGFLHQYPNQGFLFLLASLGFVGLPFTPTFIGIDLMFTHVDKDEYLLIVFTSITFLFLEISVLRLYARVFLGPSQRLTHPVAYRSS